MTTAQGDLELIDPAASAASRRSSGPRRRVRMRERFPILSNRKAVTGLVILLFFVVIAVIGPMIAPYDPDTNSSDTLLPPGPAHWLGTTGTGQDVLSQLLVGTRGVMLVGLTAGVIATFIAVVVGVTAGYIGGIGDEILGALANVFLVVPALPLIILVSGSLPSAGGVTVAVVIAVTGWAWGARVLRAQTLSLRRRDFVEAARASGESQFRIVFFEILPNLLAIIAAGFVGTVIFAVLSEVSLSFIGIASVSEWNWGTTLFWAQSGQAFALGAWWWYAPAGLCIAIVGTALTLINFGIDEVVNPRLRSTSANARTLRRNRIRPRIGFTPVHREGSDR